MPENRRYPRPAPPPPDDQEHFPDEFIIPATDEDGVSERCQFRCSPRLHAWMDDIVLSKKFPFRREGDLMRYGLYLACWTLTRLEPGVSSMQSYVDAANAMVRREELRSDVNGHIERLTKCITDLQRKKAWGEIVSVLAEERRLGELSVKVEPYWGREWLNMLSDRFEAVENYALAKLDPVKFRLNRNGDGQ